MLKLKNELKNIENVIRLKTETVEALNARLANLQSPPSMYIQEREELCLNLVECNIRQRELQEAIARCRPEDSAVDVDCLVSCIPSGPNVSAASTDAFSDQQENNVETSTSCVAPSLVIRAHLPHQQRTSVSVRAGVTVRHALSRALFLRKLTPENCVVYRSNTNVRLSWDADITTLDTDEIRVEMIEDAILPYTTTTSISHNFVRKTFFPPAQCNACRRVMFIGFVCRACYYKFHVCCSDKLPPLCHSRSECIDTIYQRYEHLLANNAASNLPLTNASRTSVMPASTRTAVAGEPGAVRRPGADVATIALPPICRERSTSAPNVSLCQVEPISVEQLQRICAGGTTSLTVPGRTTDQQQRCQQISPAKYPHYYSTQGSPSSQPRSSRPRARSADESADKKVDKQHFRETIEDWEIPWAEVLLSNKIGSGSFGTVFKAHWHGPVAVKILNLSDPSPAQLSAFNNEVATLRKTRHVNILLFMGFMRHHGLAIVTQWCEGSSLYKHIHVNERCWDSVYKLDLARQASCGIEYLHSKDIIHRDIKSNNIFLHNNGTVKIGDFGLATVKARWSGNHQVQQPTGSILWMAPEVIRMRAQNPYSCKSDVYALGIVLYELFSHKLPYTHIDNKDQILFMVGMGRLSPDLRHLLEDTPRGIKKIIRNCIKPNPHDRPDLNAIELALNELLQNVPKIQRSQSDSCLLTVCGRLDQFIASVYPGYYDSEYSNGINRTPVQ